ncbi:MAG TPA: alpha/beta fold hydrolase [Calditrichae bacterium]|nr:alpha/beta fold hydrolase [Calditrichia bacterium]
MRKPKAKRPVASSTSAPVMPGAEPIFIDQGEKGLLFLHGFTGSPYEGRDFAEYFKEKGYTIWVPLLPGHGTHPRDMEHVTWEDWYRAARNHLFKLQRKCRKVAVVGQSMGAALAMNLAAHYPFDALVTLAGFVFLTDWRLKLLPVARHVLRYQYKSKGPDIRSREAKKRSASYHKYPVKSIQQLLALIEHVRGDLLDIHIPTYLVHAKRDHVVPYSNLDYLYNHIGSKIKKRLLVENSYHIVSVDYDKDLIFKELDAFFKKYL